MAGVLASLAATPALAGPPYTTDDPEPTDTGHWEDRLFFDGEQTPGFTSGQAGLDINYGAAKDVQLTLLAPIDYQNGGGKSFAGSANLQLSVKYRFLHQNGVVPDVAIFPQINIPTQARAFGPCRLGLYLPIWAEKDFGPWSTFGGGGYDINPGPGNRNFTLVGWAVTRQVSKQFNLGLEVFHETGQTVDAKALTAIAAGAVWQFSKHFALMASAGPALQQDRSAGQGVFYLALQFTK